MKLLEVIPSEDFLNIVPDKDRFNLLIINRNIESDNWKESVLDLTSLLNCEKEDKLILIIRALLKSRAMEKSIFEELTEIIPDKNIANVNYELF